MILSLMLLHLLDALVHARDALVAPVDLLRDALVYLRDELVPACYLGRFVLLDALRCLGGGPTEYGSVCGGVSRPYRVYLCIP